MKVLMSFGFAELLVKGRGRSKEMVIAYGGNMGARLGTEVRPCVDRMFGKPVFNKLYAVRTAEKGSPDYMWSMSIPAEKFDKIFLAG